MKTYLNKAAAAFVLAASLAAGNAYAQNPAPAVPAPATQKDVPPSANEDEKLQDLFVLANAFVEEEGKNSSEDVKEKIVAALTPAEAQDIKTLWMDLALMQSAGPPSGEKAARAWQHEGYLKRIKMDEIALGAMRRCQTDAELRALLPATLHTKVISDGFKAQNAPNLAAIFAPAP
jgi:hypothetical protein